MILAIDLGSTSFKSAILNEKGREIAFHKALLSYTYGSNGEIELTPQEVDRALADAVHGVESQFGFEPLRAVAIASQAQTYTVMRNGQAATPFISWQDARAVEGARAVASSLSGFAEHTSFHDVLPQLLVSKVQQLQAQDKTYVGSDGTVVHLPSYVAWRLTGMLATDRNLAAMSGLYSLEMQDWWGDALSICGLSDGNVTPLIPIGESVGMTNGSLGLPTGIPVILGGNDQTAGAYGADLHAEEGSILITLGTAQVAYEVSRTPAVAAEGLIRGEYPGSRYYRLVADDCGGSLLNWAQSLFFGSEDDTAFFEAAAKAEPGCRGLRFNAELPAGRGSWSGMGMHHGRPEFCRSILECLCERMAELLGVLVGDWDGRRILVAGGGSRYPLWLDLLEDRLEASLEPTEASPLTGAAMMARDYLRG
ncbi:MAG: FGGY family carbohydrate kinase [Planctomycetota bacterium]|jgi:sugar (pentulose or hexulose) kinase